MGLGAPAAFWFVEVWVDLRGREHVLDRVLRALVLGERLLVFGLEESVGFPGEVEPAAGLVSVARPRPNPRVRGLAVEHHLLPHAGRREDDPEGDRIHGAVADAGPNLDLEIPKVLCGVPAGVEAVEGLDRRGVTVVFTEGGVAQPDVPPLIVDGPERLREVDSRFQPRVVERVGASQGGQHQVLDPREALARALHSLRQAVAEPHEVAQERAVGDPDAEQDPAERGDLLHDRCVLLGQFEQFRFHFDPSASLSKCIGLSNAVSSQARHYTRKTSQRSIAGVY